VTTDGPLEICDPGLVAELRGVLLAAGYTGEAVRAALDMTGELLARRADTPVHVRRLADLEPLGTIVRLFVLDAPVTAADARKAFAPLPVERLEALGLVASAGGEVTPLVRIVPHDDVLIASDQRWQAGEERDPDHVAGVHGPSVTLSNLTVRRPGGVTLDVGTGCGIQAILASHHSERVVATDLNRRALNFAAFNARLNGVDNVEFRAGSFFEPVEGSRFDLVVCNPPYVISPESAFLFRDSGLPGDAVSEGVVRQAPAFLEGGAFATVLVSWVHAPGEDWSAPLRRWVEGSGCDAWLLHYGMDDPLTHAAKWMRDELGHDSAAYDEALTRWLEYFDRLGIEAIAYGAVVLRRRAGGSNWVRVDELPGERLRPAGAHIVRIFAAQDFLVGLADDRELLGERLALAESDLLEQRVVFRDREWVVDEITLSLQEGVGFRATLDSPTAGLLAGLDGRRTLAEVADELARVQGASRESIEQAVLPIARRMLEAGFLVRNAP